MSSAESTLVWCFNSIDPILNVVASCLMVLITFAIWGLLTIMAFSALFAICFGIKNGFLMLLVKLGRMTEVEECKEEGELLGEDVGTKACLKESLPPSLV